ncbi:MAG: hypothetical protein JXJ20_15570 [Anaerolineae bacterium]|nr:hypothetical protein [Anaerolineae bacterium]
MKHLFVFMLISVMTLSLVPQTSAQDSGYIVYASGGWDIPCGEGRLGGGVAAISVDVYAPTGSMEEDTFGVTNYPFIGDFEWTWAWPGFHLRDLTWYAYVPDNGSTYETRDLYAEGGSYIASIEFYAECPSGIIEIFNNSIYGVHMPDPAERVQAKVLFDVNVHSEPNPDAAIPGAVLLAGQDWFVVSSVVGTDGNLWYEVFVGGAHNGFVPAAAMSLPAPLPE